MARDRRYPIPDRYGDEIINLNPSDIRYSIRICWRVRIRNWRDNIHTHPSHCHVQNEPNSTFYREHWTFSQNLGMKVWSTKQVKCVLSITTLASKINSSSFFVLVVPFLTIPIHRIAIIKCNQFRRLEVDQIQI